MKALITGANGMLADALCPLLAEGGNVTYLTDINGVDDKNIFHLNVADTKEVNAVIKRFVPDIIMHLAAETDVDKCELNPDHAYNVNTKGTENMVLAAKQLKIPLVYISTGAVFNGQKKGLYEETDTPDPISVYGKSKYEGERIVLSNLQNYYIFRAGWMIGGYLKDKKFVAKIVDLARVKKEIPVVTDKFGSPTFTKDFSKGICSVLSSGKYGLYHMSNKGSCSRFEIAERIVEYMARDVIVKPVTSEAFPLPAPRGDSEALMNRNLERIGLNNMRPWQEALKEYIKELG